MSKEWLNLALIRQHSLDMRQFIDFRESTLPDGMRIIDAYNSSGLTFTLLPDRGMDIWSAHYNGMPLTWLSPGSPHRPDYGQSWLGLFNGGLLTTCGLDHVGPPEDGRDIHGDYTRQRAAEVSIERSEHAVRLSAVIHQSSLFGRQFTMKRTYSLLIGEPRITIRDEIVNRSDQPAPFMLLYHCNFGYPLIRKGTELVVASDVYPRDAAAQAGIDTWQHYDEAAPNYPEQVFFHHPRVLVDDSGDIASASLIRDDIGLEIAWNTRHMPYLTQWKNTRQGIYVCGVEPGNCIPEGQNAARQSGRLVVLQPGEQQTFELMLTILDTAEARTRARDRVQQVQHDGLSITTCNLQGYTHKDAR